MILPFNFHVWTSKNLDKCRQMNDYNMTKHVNSRALAGRSMWGTMAKARLLQKTFTLLFCSFKFCSWFSTRKKAKLPSKTFLLHHHLLFLHQDSRRESLPKILQRFPYLSPSFLYQQEIWKEKVFFLKRQFLWPRLVEWEDNGKRKSEKVANGLFWTFHLDVQQQQIVSDPREEQWWGRV